VAECVGGNYVKAQRQFGWAGVVETRYALALDKVVSIGCVRVRGMGGQSRRKECVEDRGILGELNRDPELGFMRSNLLALHFASSHFRHGLGYFLARHTFHTAREWPESLGRPHGVVRGRKWLEIVGNGSCQGASSLDPGNPSPYTPL
jgi:hypothetical protein